MVNGLEDIGPVYAFVQKIPKNIIHELIIGGKMSNGKGRIALGEVWVSFCADSYGVLIVIKTTHSIKTG